MADVAELYYETTRIIIKNKEGIKSFDEDLINVYYVMDTLTLEAGKHRRLRLWMTGGESAGHIPIGGRKLC